MQGEGTRGIDKYEIERETRRGKIPRAKLKRLGRSSFFEIPPRCAVNRQRSSMRAQATGARNSNAVARAANFNGEYLRNERLNGEKVLHESLPL